MWHDTNNNLRPVVDVNAKMLALEGELEDEQAMATLAEFLYANPAYTWEMISGLKMLPMQELIIKGWMRNDYNLAIWSRGAGKTLTYNKSSQLLSRDHGLIALPDLLPNVDFSKEGWVDIPDIHLWNGDSWQLSSKIYVQPQKNCLRLTTRDGYFLEGSTNHLIKVLNTETLKAEWKRYNEIKVGDYACISRSESEWGAAVSQQDLDEAYLMGLLIGDGCYAPCKRGGIGLTSIDEEILAFVEKFPHTARYPKTGTAAVDIGLSLPYARTFQTKYGFESCLSYDKAIPASVLKSKSLARECLIGMFDTDGTTDTDGTSYTTVSRHLAHQLQSLLLTFGIVSVLSTKKTRSRFGKSYTVHIRGTNQDLFAAKVGFRLSRKRGVLESHLGKKRNTNRDVIPGAMQHIQRCVKTGHRLKKCASTEWRTMRRGGSQKNLSYNSLSNHVNFFQRNGVSEDGLAQLRSVLKDHLYYSPITQIDSFQHDCIDFNVPTGARYWANGFINHNSYSVAMFVLLHAIFTPKCRVVVVSFAFRSSRRLLEQCVKFVNEKGANVLSACFPKDMYRKTDEWVWELPNGSTITSLPLGDGRKIRGTRADVLIVDEFAYLPENVIGEVLQPFMAANSNVQEQIITKQREDKLIARGFMKEDERTIVEDFKKTIFLSSACYQFEHMYRRYVDWTDLITKPEKAQEIKASGATYFISRFGWEAIPKEILNTREIEASKRLYSEAMFKREYGAVFQGDSDGFYRAKKIMDCSIVNGQSPCVEITGERGAEYVLGVDQSMSGSESSDHFAMCLMKIVKRGDGMKIGMVVHSYAVAGGNLKDHMLYLWYLLRNFNIVYIAVDSSHGDQLEFISSCNQSERFKSSKIELLSIEADFKGTDFTVIPQQIKRSYNRQMGRIVHKQPFSSHFQERANDYLQASFDHKWIMFAGKICANEAALGRALGTDISVLKDHESFQGDKGEPMSTTEFLEIQDNLLDLTRKELAMIQVNVSNLGIRSFLLPVSAKKTSGPNKERKDSYSALVLCNWAVKTYLETVNLEAPSGPIEIDFRLVG